MKTDQFINAKIFRNSCLGLLSTQRKAVGSYFMVSYNDQQPNMLIHYSIIYTSFKFRIHKSVAISITNSRSSTSVHHCFLISAKNTLIARLISNILCKYVIVRPAIHFSQLMQKRYGNLMKVWPLQGSKDCGSLQLSPVI